MIPRVVILLSSLRQLFDMVLLLHAPQFILVYSMTGRAAKRRYEECIRIDYHCLLNMQQHDTKLKLRRNNNGNCKGMMFRREVWPLAIMQEPEVDSISSTPIHRTHSPSLLWVIHIHGP